MKYSIRFKRWVTYQKKPVYCPQDIADIVSVTLPDDEEHNDYFAWDVIKAVHDLDTDKWYFRSTWQPRDGDYVEYQFHLKKPKLTVSGDTESLGIPHPPKPVEPIGKIDTGDDLPY